MPTLQLRIFLLFCVLLLVVESVTLVTIYASMREEADRGIDTQLAVGRQVFLDQFESRRGHLSVYSNLIGKDFGLLSTLHDDPRSLAVALNNHRTRVGADLAVVTDLDGRELADTVRPTRVGQRFELADAPFGSEAAGGSLFLEAGARVYQVVAAPLLAPTLVGRIYLGFAVDDALAQQFRAITSLQVSFVVARPGAPARLIASTLPAAMRAELAAAVGASATVADAHRETLGGEEFMSRAVPLSDRPDATIVAELQRSRDEALAAYQPWWYRIIEVTLAILALAMVGAWSLARGLVRPVRALVEQARAIGRGNYAQPITTREGGELGELVHEFNQMQGAIAEREASIRFHAYHDPLTGLFNRARLEQLIDERIAGARGADRRLAVMIVDLDRFKDINETLGYHAGDRLLREVAARLDTTVAAHEVVARLGGNEFGLLVEIGALGDIHPRLDAMHEALVPPFESEGLTLNLSAAIGTAIYPEHGADALTLLRHADSARFTAKEKHLRYALFDGTQDRYSLLRVSLLGELKAAMQRGDLVLHYQPKLHLAHDAVGSVEALVRWQHPVYGTIPPSEFIPMVERTGNIQMLTLWVLREALRQSAAWDALGLAVQVAVNVSAHDLRVVGFVDEVRRALTDAGLAPARLLLEITESAVVDESAQVVGALDQLHAHGVSLSIDDYGTGYSSLAQLKRLPVDELKIDQSFVAGMDRNADDETIVRSTIDLGHTMGLAVTAEGVETQLTLDALRRMGCDVVQGYHLSRPMPAAQLAGWLRAQGWRKAAVGEA